MTATISGALTGDPLIRSASPIDQYLPGGTGVFKGESSPDYGPPKDPVDAEGEACKMPERNHSPTGFTNSSPQNPELKPSSEAQKSPEPFPPYGPKSPDEALPNKFLNPEQLELRRRAALENKPDPFGAPSQLGIAKVTEEDKAELLRNHNEDEDEEASQSGGEIDLNALLSDDLNFDLNEVEI